MSQIIPIKPVPITADDAPQLVSLYEKQKKIYARSVNGWFSKWRWAMVWLTQIVFYGLPWLAWNGRQAVLFDLEARRFYIFDLVLYPQDFIYLTGILILSAFALFFFTTVGGRLWCGYACPQTVYTEIYMWVEKRIEGERGARMKLDSSGWTLDKAWRKTAKHVVWIVIGLWTGFTFVGYFTPIHTLAAESFTLSFGPWEWFWVNFYGFATYGNAGFMREQVCKYMCPYARFQSAMFDHDTMIVSYDTARGEPRGKRGRGADLKAANLGDCIDCGLCVQVCPVGIDIRNGLQYECIACTACIDACDSVMDKMRYPRGLVRYATQNGLTNKLSRHEMLARVRRPRVLIYGAVLVAITTAFVVSLSMRHTLKVDVVRDRNTLARIVDEGRIENIYRLQMMNASERVQHVSVSVSGLPGMELATPAEVDIGAAQARWVTMAVRVPYKSAQAAGPGAHPIKFEIVEAAPGAKHGATLSEKSTFVVPR